MTERRGPGDQNQTPEDIASLYSWANLNGARYRDFSAARAQMRERARMHEDEPFEEQRLRSSEARNAIEAQGAAVADCTSDTPRIVDLSTRPSAEKANSPRILQPADSRPAKSPAPPPQTSFPPSGQSDAPVAGQPKFASGREENPLPQQKPWVASQPKETLGRPAWLATEEAPAQPQPIPPAPTDTIQGSREQMASRWFALKDVFNGTKASGDVTPAPTPTATSVPVLAVFSLAGGVGKTSLVAMLGRALAGRGERVLLVDTTAYGLLPFYFGARDQRPGMLRTFTSPGTAADAPIQTVTLDPESLGSDKSSQDMLTGEIANLSRGSNRVIVDLATASGATTRRVLRLNPTVLVPVLPDMNSVVSVGSIDSFFVHNAGSPGKPTMPFYVLNQFDSSLPLHLDVREVLREQLGDRLLPFVLRRTPAVSEALAEGMTAVDYAPSSTVVEDFASLAAWVKNLAAPAKNGFGGVRWSER